MIAPRHLKHAPRIRIRPLLDVFDPRAIHRERDMVLRLARNGASVAADALPVIDNESVSHVGKNVETIQRGRDLAEQTTQDHIL